MSTPNSAEAYEPHVGSRFVLGDGQELELVAVDRLPEVPGAPRGEPFALLFAGAAVVEQATHALTHAALGTLAIFMVPVGPGGDGRLRYESVFN